VSGLSDGSSSWAAVPRAAESGRLGRTGKRVCGRTPACPIYKVYLKMAAVAGEPEPQAEQNFKLKAILSWSPV
jgi:hypothetical protein